MVGGRGSCKKTVRRVGSAGKIQTGPDERPLCCDTPHGDCIRSRGILSELHAISQSSCSFRLASNALRAPSYLPLLKVADKKRPHIDRCLLGSSTMPCS